MQDKKLYIFPVIFVLVLVPIMIIALVTYQPGKAKDCNCPALPAAHTHGTALASSVQNGMQLLFNVSPGAELYQVVDGKLELCGKLTGDMKHVTVDVNDASLALGERLPVAVDLVIRRADSGDTVVQASAPAMYSPGHGYHFGDNFVLASDTEYEWTVTVSPVKAARQEGAQDLWREPVEWQGRFALDAQGGVVGSASSVQPVGDFTQNGVHITLGTQNAIPLYDSEGTALDLDPASRYFVVDVTDHAINYEEKLPGADVTLTFTQGSRSFEVVLEPVISPVYGFHYGANVALEPGTWQIKVTVDGLDFLRHASAAVSLPRGALSQTFEYTLE